MSKKTVKKEVKIKASYYSTKDIRIKNKLNKEGYDTTESIMPEPMTHVLNVHSSLVRKEVCVECKNYVCTCKKS